jgi:pSer/pThr/pTyr-binding forkhead associated (FHA) protein
MEVKLVVVGGAHAGEAVPVPHSKFLIGRAEDCHLRPASELVSRHHAVILVDEAFVAIRDFASKNGTFVNGEKIKSETELKAGDRLRIGPLEFEVQLAVPVAGKKKPKVHNVQEAAARTVESVRSAPDNEMDIGDWLGDEDDSRTETKTAELQSLETMATAASDFGDTTKIPGEGKQQETPSDQEDDKQKSADFARRLAELKKQPAVDSTSAADDVLRKFFGRKS